MQELYNLRELFCKELKAYWRKNEISGQVLDVVDKLSRTIKNIDKIIETNEEQEGRSMDSGSYAESSYRGRYGDGMYRGTYEGSYDGVSNRERSYARGRGSNAQRDSMGRYADSDSMISDLREMMNETQDARKRIEIQKFISKLESM